MNLYYLRNNIQTPIVKERLNTVFEKANIEIYNLNLTDDIIVTSEDGFQGDLEEGIS